MLTKQSQHRADTVIVLYFLINELFDSEEQDKFIEELVVEEDLFPGVNIDENGNETPIPPISFPVFSSPCGHNCCGWHASAAEDIMSHISKDDAFEDDGISIEFINKLLIRVFEKVGEHYINPKTQSPLTPSTISDDCIRKFENNGEEGFFRRFLSGLTNEKPNPLTMAMENKLAADETVYDIRNYVNSLGYKCIVSWLY